jgi:hypothetical protein
MAGIFAWSTSAGSNTSVGGVSIPTGMSPANVDNALRAIAAEVRVSFHADLETFLNGTAALPVANGGTGATSAATGLAALGGLATSYKGLPFTAKTGAFTFATTDEGVGIRYTGSAAAATINPVSSTAYTVGAVIPVRVAHNSSGALTLTRGSGVSLRIAGQTTDQNVTCAVGSYAVLIHESSNVWLVVGTGIS